MLFALAFISCNMSLLISEIYQASLVKVSISAPFYALDFYALLFSISTRHLRAISNPNLCPANLYPFRNAVARLPAYIFSVDRVIDPSHVRDK